MAGRGTRPGDIRQPMLVERQAFERLEQETRQLRQSTARERAIINMIAGMLCSPDSLADSPSTYL